jgi:antitoxin (DNA-binding transcriptional repressor) of toxin-antitoxin stability system
MSTINIYEAKTQLSKLVEQAAAGKDIVHLADCDQNPTWENDG